MGGLYSWHRIPAVFHAADVTSIFYFYNELSAANEGEAIQARVSVAAAIFLILDRLPKVIAGKRSFELYKFDQCRNFLNRPRATASSS